jgi:hypothetical protein
MKLERLLWENYPTYFRFGEAWSFIDGSWTEVDSSEVNRDGLVLTEEGANSRFRRLPPLPEEAFPENSETTKTSD